MKKILSLLILILPLSLYGQNPTPLSGVSLLKTSKWPASTPDGKVIINVSWDNPSPANDREREWVKEAVQDTWEKYANVEFIGWGKSNPSSTGIRILIKDDAHPHTTNLGTKLDGVPGGMVLTFKFTGEFKCDGLTPESCIKFIAVHEFGHALGLAHEQNRRDCLCNEPSQGLDGDCYITPCDINSVMNYCNPKWNNYGQLSPLDVAGIQIVYGRPVSGRRVIQPTPILQLNEVRIIACTHDTKDRVKTIKNLIASSLAFEVNNFTVEDKPVPQKAIGRLHNLITIRYFDEADEGIAENIKNLLAIQGYKGSNITIENMIPVMTSRLPKYIEIWTKEPITPSTVNLDEIRLIPCNKTTTVADIKQTINNSSLFDIKNYTQEDKPVPQRAIDRLNSTITIRYFDPNDEVKADNLKKLLENQKFANNSIVVENMLPKMSRIYPNYIEIWSK